MHTSIHRKRHLVLILALLVLAAVIYLPSINGEFIFDDYDNIAENPIIKDLSYYSDSSQATDFDRYATLKRRPVGYLTLTANYFAGGLDTTGYHLVNVLIHVVNTLLVYILVILVFKTPFLRNSGLAWQSPAIALLTALIFSTHPVQTQAVSYVVQRFASLATLFYLMSLVCYLAFRLLEGRNRKILFYVLSLAAAVLGMKTKEIAFTLPLSVLMFELFFFTGPVWKRLAWWVPMGLTMLIIPLTIIELKGLTTLSAQSLDKSLRVRTQMARGDFLITEFRVMVTYLRLITLPFNQNLDYSYPVFKSFLEPAVWISLMFLGALAGMSIYLFLHSQRGYPGLRVVAAGIVWFFLTLSIESTLIPLFVIFEHRLYLPMAGVSFGAATGAVLLYGHLKSFRLRKAALIFIISVPIMFTVASVVRNFTWRTEISMWEDVIQKTYRKSRAHLSLGNAYRKAGMEEKSMEQYKASLQAQSFDDYITRILTFINMGNYYFKSGDNTRAIEYYRSSIEINPDYEMSYYNLATVYLSMGDADKALKELKNAIEKNSGFAPAYYMTGEALMKMDQPEKAVESYRKSLELDPKLDKALLGLGSALEALGMHKEALVRFQEAARKMPDLADAHYQLGNAFRENGDIDRARDAWARAVELDPSHAGALSNLGGYYILQNDYAKAVQYMTRSLEIEEKNVEAHFNLATALETLGRPGEAALHYKRFIELAPPEYADVVERIKAKFKTSE